MGKMKTLSIIADHVACSYVEEMQEQISELLYAEGVIEEMDDVTCDIVDAVMKLIGQKLIEKYTDDPLYPKDKHQKL